MARRTGLVASLALAALAPACFVNTQRLPSPMESTLEPLPPGTIDLYPEGPEEVLVLRLADPARVRPAGLPSSYPLRFYRKQVRLNAGSWVECGNARDAPRGTVVLTGFVAYSVGWRRRESLVRRR